jgi:hypothetical protein
MVLAMIGLLISARVWANGVSASIWAYLIMDKFHVGNAVCRWTRWQFRGLAGPIPWLESTLRASLRLPLAQYWGGLTILSLLGVWFLLPFVLIRYGLRDRLTQFTCAIFLLFLPFTSGWRGAAEIAHTAVTVTFIAALCLRQWRHPAIIYVLAGWINVKVLQLMNRFLFHFVPHFWTRHPALIAVPQCAGYAAMAVTCLILHRVYERRPLFTFPPRTKRVCVS